MADVTIMVGDQIFRLTRKEAAALRKGMIPDVLVNPSEWTGAELKSRNSGRETLLQALFSAEKNITVR